MGDSSSVVNHARVRHEGKRTKHTQPYRGQVKECPGRHRVAGKSHAACVKPKAWENVEHLAKLIGDLSEDAQGSHHRSVGIR